MRPILYALSLSIFCIAAPLGASPELVDRIVAVIDNQVILWSELNYRLRFEIEQRSYAAYAHPDSLARLRDQLLESMIDEQVLVLKAQKDSVQIDQSEVAELLAEQFRLAKSSMNEAEFAGMLERVGLTERQLKARYRKEIRHRLLYRQLRTQVAYRLYITHRDLEAFRRAHQDTLPPQISISHINLKVRPSDEVLTGRRAVIAEVQQQLQAGADFASLARRYSEDPGTADRGGDLGCFGAGQLMPEFEEAAFKLKPGEISQPVLTGYGYHLIQLHEKREDAMCASHILVMARTVEGDEERTRKKLEELRQRAGAGEEFAQLARAYSDNPQTAMRGGLWDVFPRDQVPLFLQPYLRGLKLGEVSEPFFLEDGGHILKLNDDQATLESLIREERTAAAMQKLIEDYKKEIYVEKRLDQDFLKQPEYGSSGYLSEEHRTDQTAQ